MRGNFNVRANAVIKLIMDDGHIRCPAANVDRCHAQRPAFSLTGFRQTVRAGKGVKE